MMLYSPRTLAGAAAICLLAACSPAAEEQAGQEEQPLVQAPPAITLTPLSEADIVSADLPDELACAFSEGGNTLLFARAFVGDSERGAAIVRLDGGQIVRLETPHEGGFGAMERRGEFSAEDIAIDIEPVSGNRAEHEGSDYDAILTLERADGTNRAWQGDWICGP